MADFSIPFFALDRQFARDRETYLRIAEEVWSTGQVLQGAPVREFEACVAEKCGRAHGVAVGSCTDALAFSMMACGIGPGDEVIVTCYSFIASVSAIVRVGAKPVFVDIDPDLFVMDVERIEEKITPATKAILAVHLFGQTLDMTRLDDIANRHGLILVEDAAQVIGAFDNGRPGGSLGRVSCLSFDPTKVVGSFSSAGAVVTDDPEIARFVTRMRYHGRDPETRRYDALGFNSQVPTDMAAMLTFKLGKLDQWNQERGEIAAVFNERLGQMEEVRVPQVRAGSTHTWHKYVMRVQDRDGLARHLKEKGVATMMHYSSLLTDLPYVREITPDPGEFPAAREACGDTLSLPIYPEMRDEEADYIVNQVKAFYA